MKNEDVPGGELALDVVGTSRSGQRAHPFLILLPIEPVMRVRLALPTADWRLATVHDGEAAEVYARSLIEWRRRSAPRVDL